jgi:histidinol-phosphate phosphatase family protein
MKNLSPQPAVFLDRDGTLCEESEYLSRADDLRVFPFAAQAVRLLNENGFLAILITNQSGVGRGMFSEKALADVHERLHRELKSGGAKLDGIYFCPHAPAVGCKCRKPGTKMIDRAARDFHIDYRYSWMVGDKAIDIETGQNAGIKTALVLTGYGQTESPKCDADIISSNISDAVNQILDGFNPRTPAQKPIEFGLPADLR